jgi:hypothetical protein
MKRAINKALRACAIVINELSYIAIFDYIRKGDRYGKALWQRSMNWQQ